MHVKRHSSTFHSAVTTVSRARTAAPIRPGGILTAWLLFPVALSAAASPAASSTAPAPAPPSAAVGATGARKALRGVRQGGE